MVAWLTTMTSPGRGSSGCFSGRRIGSDGLTSWLSIACNIPCKYEPAHSLYRLCEPAATPDCYQIVTVIPVASQAVLVLATPARPGRGSATRSVLNSPL